MMRAIAVLTISAAVSLVGSARAIAQGTPSASAPRRDITGYWHYNSQASDNPSSMIPRDSAGRGGGSEGGGGFSGGRRGGMGGRGGSGGGRGGMGGGGMGGRPGMSEAGRERIRQTMQLAMDPPGMLRIVRDDSTVTLVSVSISDSVRLHTNGKKVREKVEGAGDLEIKAEWKDDGLIVERKVDGGGKVTETYFRSSDNRQMMVIVKVETSRLPKPMEFRRVYDAVAEGT